MLLTIGYMLLVVFNGYAASVFFKRKEKAVGYLYVVCTFIWSLSLIVSVFN